MQNKSKLSAAGFRIIRARKIAGVSQRELAERLQVSPSMVSQWERGIRKPKNSTMLRIAEALGVDVQELIATKKALDEDGNTGYILENDEQVKQFFTLMTYSDKVNTFLDICDKFGIAYIQSGDGEAVSFLNLDRVEPNELLDFDSIPKIYRELLKYLMYQIFINVHQKDDDNGEQD